MNRENLKKLADYLLTGNLKAEFDISIYGEKEASATNCRSVGCAVGHGPYAGIRKYKKESWVRYSERVFGASWRDGDWEHWCFSGVWVGVDNTPEGAGKRILWLLEYGLPKDWVEQMWGEAKLCYK